MTTRTEPRPAAAHVPPTPPPPAPAGMALTELLAALEGERRTHAAAVRAGSTRQEATMREPTMREPDAHAGASEPTAGVYGAPCPTCGGIGVVPGRDDEQTCHTCEGACFVEFVCPGERTCRVCPEHQYSEPQDQR